MLNKKDWEKLFLNLLKRLTNKYIIKYKNHNINM